MTLPTLYLEGLAQRALGGDEHLNAYKLGLIEAVLKEALRVVEPDVTSMRSAMQTALEVARWDMPRPASGGHASGDTTERAEGEPPMSS